eukprot:COSAG04_NODE_4904_length_1832_cov_1.200231_1_plen_218_part_00
MASTAAQASSEPTGGGCSLVRVRLSNTGHLPTYGSLQSMTAKAVRDQALAQIELAVRLPTGAPLPLLFRLPRNACRRCCAPLPKRSKPSLPISIECYASASCCHSTNVPLASIKCIAVFAQQDFNVGNRRASRSSAAAARPPSSCRTSWAAPCSATTFCRSRPRGMRAGWISSTRMRPRCAARNQRLLIARFFLCTPAFCRFRLRLPCLSLLDGSVR